MPAANVSYFENLWYRQKSKKQAQAVKDILVVTIVFVGVVMYPAGPEVY
jgi:hypothetical protein